MGMVRDGFLERNDPKDKGQQSNKHARRGVLVCILRRLIGYKLHQTIHRRLPAPPISRSALALAPECLCKLSRVLHGQFTGHVRSRGAPALPFSDHRTWIETDG